KRQRVSRWSVGAEQVDQALPHRGQLLLAKAVGVVHDEEDGAVAAIPETLDRLQLIGGERLCCGKDVDEEVGAGEGGPSALGALARLVESGRVDHLEPA